MNYDYSNIDAAINNWTSELKTSSEGKGKKRGDGLKRKDQERLVTVLSELGQQVKAAQADNTRVLDP